MQQHRLTLAAAAVAAAALLGACGTDPSTDGSADDGAGTSPTGTTSATPGAGLTTAHLLTDDDTVYSDGADWFRTHAAEGDGQELLAAADAENGLVAGERAADEGELGVGALLLQGDAVVPLLVAVEAGIDVERAAGDDEGVDGVEIGGGEAGVRRGRDARAAGGRRPRKARGS